MALSPATNQAFLPFPAAMTPVRTNALATLWRHVAYVLLQSKLQSAFSRVDARPHLCKLLGSRRKRPHKTQCHSLQGRAFPDQLIAKSKLPRGCCIANQWACLL